MKRLFLIIAFFIGISYTEGFHRISRAAKLANKECLGSDCEDEQKLDKVNIAENQKQVQDKSSSPVLSSSEPIPAGSMSSTETVISYDPKINGNIKQDDKVSSSVKTETAQELTSKIIDATTITPNPKSNKSIKATPEDKSEQKHDVTNSDTKELIDFDTENQMVASFYILNPSTKEIKQGKGQIQLNPLLKNLLPKPSEDVPILYFDLDVQPINRPQDIAENNFDASFPKKPQFYIEPSLISSKYSDLNMLGSGVPTKMEEINQPSLETTMVSGLLKILLQNVNPEYKTLSGIHPLSEAHYLTAMNQNYNGPVLTEFGVPPDPQMSLSSFWKVISSMSERMHKPYMVQQQPHGSSLFGLNSPQSPQLETGLPIAYSQPRSNFWNTYFTPSSMQHSQNIPLIPSYTDYLPFGPTQQILSQSISPVSTQFPQQYSYQYQPQYQYLSQYQPQSQFQSYQPYFMSQFDIPQTKTFLPDLYSSSLPYTSTSNNFYSQNYPLPNYNYEVLPSYNKPQTEFVPWPCNIPSIFQNLQLIARRRRR